MPLSELAAAVSFAREEVERRGLIAGIVGHAGDGNVHLSLHVDPDDPDEVRSSDELIELLVTDALARGGTCTGEHGIGLGKVHALEREHGDLVPLMQRDQGALRPARDHEPGEGAAGARLSGARVRRATRSARGARRGQSPVACTTTAATTTRPPATVAVLGVSS